jgi:oxalate decarboxylase/phosphoglucose isomerase-like protein (cupin superfamily)
VTRGHRQTLGRAERGSSFKVVVPPGFDVGAHVHTHSEELFYVLEGELDVLAFEPRVRTPDTWQRWESVSGNRVVRATPGTVIVVPPGCPHAFANPTEAPAKMFFQASPPPDHERYCRRSTAGRPWLVAQFPAPLTGRYRIGMPARVRAITNRWISLVPSKIV